MTEHTRHLPEIVAPNEACKLCTLSKTHGNIVYVVHELFRKGIEGRTLEKQLAPVFAEAGLKVPSRHAITRHCREHFAPVEGLESAAPFHVTDTDQETDYIELRGLYGEFRAIFSEVKKERAAARAQGKPTSDYGLVMLLKLGGELRQMLKCLSEMRNSDKLFGVVLVRHTEQVINFLTEPLGTELRSLRDALTRGEEPATVAAKLDRLLSGEMFPIFQSAAEQALEQSRQQYKLTH